MSRLINKLNQVSKVVLQPMGFRAAHPASPKPQLLLIASFNQMETADRIVDYAGNADAILLPAFKTSPRTKASPKAVQSLPDIPWGVWQEKTDAKGIEALAGTGCDFVVFPAASPVFTVDKDDKLGKVLRVEPFLSEGLLRAINDMPVDAVLTAAEYAGESHLTWNHLMSLQHFANLLTKPLLVAMPPSVSASELKALWEAGIDGVVIEVSTEQLAKRLEELRQAISELNFLPPRKRGKEAAMIPRISGEAETVTETEEEEEEE